MKLTLVLMVALFGFIQTTQNCDSKTMGNRNTDISPTPPKQTKSYRLPEGIDLKTKVLKQVENDRGEVVSTEIVTVEKALSELKAKNSGEKLVDGKGREIKFFEPLCRGVSQGVDEDQTAQEAKQKELAELKKKYTVIVLYCDPEKVL